MKRNLTVNDALKWMEIADRAVQLTGAAAPARGSELDALAAEVVAAFRRKKWRAVCSTCAKLAERASRLLPVFVR